MENFSFETQKYVAIPNREDEPTEYQSCKMYDLDYGNLTDDQILNWDRNITANISLIDCTEWIYDQSVFISTINSKVNSVMLFFIYINSFVLVTDLFSGRNQIFKPSLTAC